MTAGNGRHTIVSSRSSDVCSHHTKIFDQTTQIIKVSPS